MSTPDQLAIAFKLTADASQYTATMQGAGKTAVDMGRQVQIGTTGAATGMQSVVVQTERVAPAMATAALATQQLSQAQRQAEQSTQALGSSQARLQDVIGASNRAHAAGAISAGQHAQAMRMLPVQMTDVAVSLASGMPVWMVAIQQGGQLKDSFGGAGEASKAMGGYVLGLLNPLTVGAAAVAVLGAAAYSGSEETRGLQNAIINSGNAAGVTSGQLMGMAAGVDAVAGTQGRAVEVLSAFVATGRVGAENMEAFTAAAIRFDEVGGAAAEDTVKAFADLGKAPLDASLKLNESMHYLTASTYAQIKALMEQGRTTEAADVAQKAFADTINNRSGQMAANLGLVEKGWKGIKWAVSEAWDALKAIGRDSGAEGQLAILNAAIPKLEANIAARKREGNDVSGREKQLSQLREQQSLLQSDVILGQRSASAKATQVKLTEQLVDWEKSGAQYASTKQKRDEEIAKARLLGQALINAGKLTEKQLEERIAAIRESKADKAVAGGDSELANIRARVAAESQNLTLLQRQGLHYDKLNDGERTALQLAEQLNGKLDAKARKSKEAQLVQARLLADVLNQQEAERQLLEAKSAAQVLDQKLTTQQVGQYQQSIDQLMNGNEQLRLEIDLVGKDVAARREYLAIKAQEVITAKELEVINLRNAGARDEVIAKAEQELRLLRDKAALTATVNGADDGQAAKEMLDALTHETAALAMTNEQRQVAIALRELETKGIKAGSDAYDEYIPRIRAAITNKAVVERDIETWKSIESTAKSVWTSVADSGMNAFRRVGQTLKSAVLDALWQATGRQWLISIGTAAGIPGAALAGQQGGAGGIAAQMGSVSSRGSLYNAVTNGVSNSVTAGFGRLANNSFGESLGLSQPVGYTTGSGVQYGLTDLGRTAGQYAGYAGNAVAGYGLQKAISGGYKTGESGLVDAITVAASAYFGPLAGAVAGVFNQAFGRKLAGSGVEGTFGGSAGFSGNSYTDYKGGWFRSDKTVRSDLDPALTTGLASGYKALQASVSDMAQTLGLGSAAVETYTHNIRLSTAGLTQDQIAEKLQAEFAALGTEMADLVLGTNAYTRVGEGSIDALTRLSSNLAGANATFEALGLQMYDSSLDGANMASNLAATFGGLSSMVSSSAAYFKGYYSEAEQLKLRTADLTAELAAMGRSLPATKEEFRKLVEGLDRTTAGGQAAYAKLLLLAPEFEAVADASEQAMRSLKDERKSLERDLLTAQGNTAALRALDIAGYNDAQVAAYDYNKALREQIDSYTAAQKAASDAAQSSKQVTEGLSSSRASLERDLLAAQGNTAALRLLEIAGYSDAQVAAYDYNASLRAQITTFSDAKSKAQEMAQAIASAFDSAQQSTSQTRFDLQRQLLNQQGQGSLAQQMTDAADLAALTKGLPAEMAAQVAAQFAVNIALREMYEVNARTAESNNAAMATAAEKATLATRAAAEEAVAAAEIHVNTARTAVDAAQSLQSELTDLFGVLKDAVHGLRADVESTAVAQYDAARAHISAALQVAGATGALPDRDALTADIASAKAGLAQKEFATQFQADFERLSLAGELAGLQDITGVQLTTADLALDVSREQLSVQQYMLKALQDATRLLSSAPSTAAAPSAAASGAKTTGATFATDQWSDVAGQRVYASSGGAVGVQTTGDTTIYGKDGSTFQSSQAVEFVQNQLAKNDPGSVYAAALKTGISATALDQMMGWSAGTANGWAKTQGLPAFADGGWHSGGWAMVGERGPELAYMPPAQIYTAPQTSALLTRTSPNMGSERIFQVMADTLSTMLLRLDALEANTSEGNKYSGQLANQFDRVSGGGNALAVEQLA